VTLLTGLALTMGIGLAAVGVFNIISIAFVALFVGLGVDFGIQFCVRYRSERHSTGDLETALIRAGRGVGKPLALAAAATAAGFFSFLPTSYVGVAELGLIAGIGMIVAFVLAITMLPALLMLVRPRGEAKISASGRSLRRSVPEGTPRTRPWYRRARRSGRLPPFPCCGLTSIRSICAARKSNRYRRCSI
jgi:predicted RND superfamily exporter protein